MRDIKLYLFLTLFSVAALSSSCEKEVVDPDVCYTLSIKREGETVILTEPYTVDALRKISFENCGKADFYAFFSGMPGHVWSEFQEQTELTTTGEDTKPGGDIDITYLTPGEYTATMILTNRQQGDPDNLRQVAVDFVITVTEAESK